jgi:hypothetical protein
MTKLCFNYKDVFRAMRLGFSAKKIWMSSLGLLFALAGYAVLTYIAYLTAGVDIITTWQNFRLLPFPLPYDYPFPWYSWVLYAVGMAFFLTTMLLTGTAVSRVAYEQLRGDEFYESREAFRFAFRNAGAVVSSPLLILGFIALIVAMGLVLSLVGAIPLIGEIVVALLAVPAFIASLFITYLLVVFAFSIMMGPSVVGATHNDTFDTLFEVFSCVNEQPARLIWYTTVVAALAKLGTLLLSVASSIAGRIGYGIAGAFMGDKLADAAANAAYYFRVSLPDWLPSVIQRAFVACANLLGLPQMYLPSDYVSVGWSNDTASLLLGVCFYLVALMVAGYGLATWYSGMTLSYAVLAQKKDEKNILETPEDIEELIEPPPLEDTPPAPPTKPDSPDK